MTARSRLQALRNEELLSALALLVRRGNELSSDLLAHLAELDERRLHLALGFPSLFAYCTQELGLCESAAGRRIVAARVCRKFSGALERVAPGELHLSALCALNAHLNVENAAELFELCSRKSRRQVDELLAVRFPKPDVRESIRRLPSRTEAKSADVARAVQQADVSRATQVDAAAVAEAPIVAGSIAGHADRARELRETRQNESSSVPCSAAAPRPSPSPTPRRQIRNSQSLVPLSPERFGVHFTADAEFRDLLERARALASHRLPNGDLATLMKLALEAFVRDAEKQRFAVGRKARCNATEAPRSANAQAEPATARAEPATARVEPATARVEPPNARVEPPHLPGAKSPLLGESGSAAHSSDTSGLPSGADAPARRLVQASPTPNVAKWNRHVAAAVVREVYLRDQGRCSFVSLGGRRCGERAHLELDHMTPFAVGGASTLANLRLLCRAHNQQHARDHFGRAYIDAVIATVSARREEPSPRV
jgi:HNH endonuclease